MENKHIELLAKHIVADEFQQISVEEMVMRINHVNESRGINISIKHKSALTAMQALETALTEKHRAEVEGLRKYVRHSDDCNLEDKYKFLQWCDALHDTPEKDRDEQWLSEYGKYEQMRTTCTCGLDQLL